MEEINNRIVLTEHAVKRHSRRLQKEIQDLFTNSEFTLSQAQDLFARSLGMSDWHEMHKVLFNSQKIEKLNPLEERLNNFVLPAHASTTDFVNVLVDLSVYGNINNIIIKSNDYIAVIHGNKKIKLTCRKLTTIEVTELAVLIYGSNDIVSKLNLGMDVDCPYSIRTSRATKIHYRVNMTKSQSMRGQEYEICLMKLASKACNLQELNIYPGLYKELNIKNGIFLVNGPTNSGKSTFLSSILASRITNEELNVITYESPIETIYDVEETNSIVSQVEVGRNITSFAAGVRNALRRQPDIILIGEMRDEETLKEIITASQAGHAIYSSLFANNVHESLIRMYNIVKNKNNFIELIYELSCIVNQEIIMGVDGSIIVLQEYLPFNNEVKSQIINFMSSDEIVGEKFQRMVNNLIEKYGISFKQAAKNAYSQDLITEDAFDKIYRNL
jgi:defect-in-organelle-trafficking protein DotB